MRAAGDPPTPGGPLLIVDGDCGFCAASARLAERISAGTYAVRPWQGLDLATLGLSAGECTAAAQWVHSDGRVAAGHLAVAAALRHSGGLHALWARPAGVLLGGRLFSRPVAVAYAWLAGHRRLLPGGSEACAVRCDPAASADLVAQGAVSACSSMRATVRPWRQKTASPNWPQGSTGSKSRADQPIS